jgi:hypothetical protein
MTAHELAREECANYRPDGTCPRDIIEIRDGVTYFAPYPRCNLAVGKPCRTFEVCLLAGIPMISNEKKAAEWREAEEDNERIKNEYEQLRNCKRSLERDSHGRSAGSDVQAAALDGPGGGRSGHPVGQGKIYFHGRGRAEMARSKEIKSRLSRTRF